jgi:hypothetical protein
MDFNNSNLKSPQVMAYNNGAWEEALPIFPKMSFK